MMKRVQYHRQRLWTGTYYSAGDNTSYNVYTSLSIQHSNLTVHRTWQAGGAAWYNVNHQCSENITVFVILSMTIHDEK